MSGSCCARPAGHNGIHRSVAVLERRRAYDRAYRAASSDYRERALRRRRQGRRLQAIARDRTRITELEVLMAALMGPPGARAA